VNVSRNYRKKASNWWRVLTLFDSGEVRVEGQSVWGGSEKEARGSTVPGLSLSLSLTWWWPCQNNMDQT
jgi:hypothetical protein